MDEKVKTLVTGIKDSGVEVEFGKYIKCAHCPSKLFGFFENSTGLTICQNNSKSQYITESTLVHELVHAYDFSTATLNDNNLSQRACSEVRASNLSGDCDFIREFLNFSDGFLKKFTGQKVNCVRRKASFSLSQCENLDKCETDKIVDSVFNECIANIKPFTNEQFKKF
ncbi:Mitochondrial inner membrane protease ATP23 [Clydaea vesicula]|uniref:Mitochondrial inner membrane protease ATP23 n=1 Tax=Clydaea vesicula TaxID=447962 RepID=A0AAD5Y075_9FUNG|nr:Mitochondrial inner membrane protease ATP23 [Clydaea vesicula]